ncbi:MAG: DUF6009 family protein [Pirellulaceae bacterium]|nr:DUF6009 family protein [Pirellulaceae bacterium]
MINTRTISHHDGRQEVVRVINETSLESWDCQDPFAFEQSIVWNEDVSNLDFVRVALVKNARSRRGRIRLDHRGISTVLGYSKLTVDAPLDPSTGGYSRRVFFLKEEDERLNMNAIPHNAIDPQTILPGRAGAPPKADEGGYPYYLRRE